MTNYTFQPDPNTIFVRWNDPARWVGGVVPNGTDADVTFPVVTNVSDGSVYVSSVKINDGEQFDVNSIQLKDNLQIYGSLYVSGVINADSNGKIYVAGNLTAGSITGANFNGDGIVNADNITNNYGISDTLTVNAHTLTNVAGGGFVTSYGAGDLNINVDAGGFSNLVNNTLTVGYYIAQENSVMRLNVGSMIDIDAANIRLDSGGMITTHDSAMGEDVPITETLNTIATNGILTLSGTYDFDSVNVLGQLNIRTGFIATVDHVTFSSLDIFGTANVSDGTLSASDFKIESGGNLNVSDMAIGSDIENDGTITAGSYSALGNVNGDGAIKIAAETLALQDASLDLTGKTAENIYFQDGTGALTIDSPGNFTGAIAPGGAGDTIFLPSVLLNSVTGISYAGDSNGGTLTLDEAGGAVSLNFIGDYTAANFGFSSGPRTLSTDPATTLITIQNATPLAASVIAPASVTEGADANLVVSLSLQDVTKASGVVLMSLLGSSTAGAGDVAMPTDPTSYSITQSAAGGYVLSLAPIAILDDLAIEATKTLDIQLVAPGLVFANGTNTTIVHVTLADGDQAGTSAGDTLTGTAGMDHLSGMDGDDFLSGLEGNDLLEGGAGNDRLNGGTGVDMMIGGTGNDVYYVDNAADTVTEQAGEGTDLVRTTLAAYTLGANVENLATLGTTSFVGTGNELANEIDGSGANDTLAGLAGDDHLVGNAGSDHLIGGDGNDILDGGAGADTLEGGAGNDTYIVDDAGDVVIEGVNGGNDTVRTSLGGYTLGANVENLVYTGTGNFVGTGNALANGLYGGAGNDVLDGGAGPDHMEGGAGNDTYYVDNANDVIVEGLNAGTDEVRSTAASYTLSANLENLVYVGTGAFTGTGNDLDNTLTGGAGNDVLSGGGGNDVIDGGAGADHMIGGTGNDLYYVDNPGDVVVEAAGGGTDEVRTSLTSYTLGANVENLTYTGSAAFTGIGNDLANTIAGGSGNDLLNGGAGADILTGGAGNDTYIVDNVGDVVVEADGGGTDTVRTELSSYTLGANVENLVATGTSDFTGTGNALVNDIYGSTGNDSLSGHEGDDKLFGDVGSDHLSGGEGNDILDGGAGADVLEGDSGNDTYLVDNVNDVVIEAAGDGNDTVRTTLSDYTLGANVENLVYTGTGAFYGVGNMLANQIYGGAGDDVLHGMGGQDQLFGAAGNDVLVAGDGGGDYLNGGAGADVLTGGNGADIFGFSSAADTGAGGKYDVITNFAYGDRIALNAIDGDTNTAGFQPLHFIGSAAFSDHAGEVRYVTDGSVTHVLGDVNGDGVADFQIDLDNLAAPLQASDFVFGSPSATLPVSTPDGPASGATTNGGDGPGVDTVRTALAAYVLGTHDTNLAYGGTGDFTGTGNDLANGVYGAAGNDVLYGRAGNDQLVGYAGNDHLIGGEGNDVLNGGAGADIMEGNSGDDTYLVDSTDDVVIENPGEGTDIVRTTLADYALGANVENLAYAGTGAFYGLGNALDNQVYGAAGDDELHGADGDDRLFGYAGSDVLVGGNGNDFLNGGAGADILTGGAGNDTFAFGTPADTGADGKYDLITDFTKGDQIAFGTIDGDTNTAGFQPLHFIGSAAFDGHAGELRYVTDGTITHVLADTNGDGVADFQIDLANLTAPLQASDFILGSPSSPLASIPPDGPASGASTNGGDGPGVDLVRTTLAAYVLGIHDTSLAYGGTGDFTGTGNDLANSIYGGAGHDILYGRDGNDQLVGYAGNDHLYGGEGNDVLNGGPGDDIMEGNSGDDTYLVDSVHDVVIENPGEGTDIVRTTLSDYTLGDNVENLAYSGTTGAFFGVGNMLDNQLSGGSGDDTLHGLDGNDQLYGYAGNDTLVGGNGTDILNGGPGADVMIGGAGNDTYYVDNPGDVIVEQTGGGSNTVYVSTASYTLGQYVDVLKFNGTGDFVGAGNSDNYNSLTGGAGNDTLSAQGSAFTDLYGLDGNDHLVGSAGTDLLVGGTGADTMTGGAGLDYFEFDKLTDFGTGGVNDLITDFSHADGDKIDISRIDANTNTAVKDAFQFIGDAEFSHHAGQLRYQTDGDITHVMGDVNGDGVADFTIDLAHLAMPPVQTDFFL